MHIALPDRLVEVHQFILRSFAVTDQCPLINFFCSHEHVDGVASAHPGLATKPLTLAQGLAHGARSFGPMMTYAQGGCC